MKITTARPNQITLETLPQLFAHHRAWAGGWSMELDTLESLQAEYQRLETELEELSQRNGGVENLASWPVGQVTRSENVTRAMDRVEDKIDIIRTQRADRAEAVDRVRRAALDQGNLEPSTRDREHSRVRSTGNQLRDRAARILEESHRSGAVDDYVSEYLERAMSGPGDSGVDMATYVEVAADPHYLTGFAKRLRDPLGGHASWTSEEAEAHRSVEQYAARAALSLSGGSSMLPLALDPTIALTNTGSTSGFRSVCRHEVTASSTWNGVTSAGATAEWKVENAQAADGTPAIAGKQIPVWLLDIDALVSYEIEQDALRFALELGNVLLDATAVAVDAALATGSGSNAPTGIMTALTGSQDVVTGGTFASANVTALQNALPARFQPNAKFVTSLPVRNAIGSFETTAGALRFPEVSNGRLLNRDLVEDSNIATDMTTSGSRFAVYGDWNQYLMVTRTGASIEMLPNYGANGRPTASRHYFMTMRVGADALVPNAFRVTKKS